MHVDLKLSLSPEGLLVTVMPMFIQFYFYGYLFLLLYIDSVWHNMKVSLVITELSVSINL